MSDHGKTRWPNLGQLSMALLEHVVEPVIGSDAREVLKAPVVEKELRESLGKTLEQAEERFMQEYADADLRRAVLELSITDFPSLKQAVRDFYDRPTDPALRRILFDHLITNPRFAPQPERIEPAVAAYLKILKEELISVSADIREKLDSLALQYIYFNTAKIVELLKPIRVSPSPLQLPAASDQLPPAANNQLPATSPNPPLSNPFFTGGRIHDPRLFFGRQHLVREMQAELPKRSCVSLAGESRVGKSSLLYYLYATRAGWLPEVTVEYVDLQRVLDERDFCEMVLQKLGAAGDSLRDLKRTLENRTVAVVLLFDEVERLAEPDFSPRLHDLLRSLAQEKLTLALATQRPLEEVFPARASSGVSPFHNIFTRKIIGPFTEPEARAFLVARLSSTGVVFDEREIERLLSESQFHPGKLQQLAKTLFAEKAAEMSDT